MTLLQKRDLARHQRRLKVLADTRHDLRVALGQLIPGSRAILFGSLTQPGLFNDRSDVDLALEVEPPNMDAGQLTAELMERLGRPVDVVLLEKCRFRQKDGNVSQYCHTQHDRIIAHLCGYWRGG